jgi:hypothetical protein
MEINPLKQYFRQPSIYIQLPSGGRFYQEGSLEPTANNEYPVLPMTTLDEITYRTPDALFNGNAVNSVIESCVPNIKHAWGMPAMDIDTILIAIRIATYGHEMDINTTCPSCANEDEYGVDLRTVMETIGRPDYNNGIDVGELKVFLKPMSYQQINENSMAQFADQKTMTMLQQASAEDETRLKEIGDMLKKITMFTTQALAQSIAMVQTPQVRVVEQEHINEWLANCDRKVFAVIRDQIIKIKKQAEMQPLHIKCTSCGNEYDQQFTLDMSNFFGAAS